MALWKYIHKSSSKIKEYFCPQLGTSGHILRFILCFFFVINSKILNYWNYQKVSLNIFIFFSHLTEEDFISNNAINLSAFPRTIRCNKSYMKLNFFYALARNNCYTSRERCPSVTPGEIPRCFNTYCICSLQKIIII